MSKEKRLREEDDPDTYLVSLSVPEARAFEQKTRNAIETQKKELRAMVGEQYHDLISAADAIISMSKNAQAIKSNFDRMQAACEIDNIKFAARNKTHQSTNVEKTETDTKRKQIYMIATLVKSLADVPEQIWHALENHRYLHASRLYTLAERVYEYIEEEKQRSIIDIELAFPVIQRQWDAVSAFKPQIIQRATHYLRVSEQASEHIAEILVGLMLLDQMSYKQTLEKLLEMRTNVIRDIMQSYTKTADSIENRISHQLRELTLVIKRTIIQLFEVFVSKEGDHTHTLVETYVKSFQDTFMIPSKFSHGNETPSQSVITRLFSPSSNVPLIVRFLPETVQNYKPHFDPSPTLDSNEIQSIIASWIDGIENMSGKELSEAFLPISNQHELVHIRTKLWEVLSEDEHTKDKNNKWIISVQSLCRRQYSLWDNLYREIFNKQAKYMIDRGLDEILKQLDVNVWPSFVDVNKQQPKNGFMVTLGIWPGTNGQKQVFSLPNLSSSKEIEEFKLSLRETANDRTRILCLVQDHFDTALESITKDVLVHLMQYDHDLFHVKEDANLIKTYFETKCYEMIINYGNGLESLIKRLDKWEKQQEVNDIAISLGRLAKNIGTLSKQVPKSLSLSTGTIHMFELRSNINKDPKYKEIQDALLDIYHKAHDTWIQSLKKSFTQKLKASLTSTKWNDQCFAVSVWENVEDDIKLPTQATQTFVRDLFSTCEEIQRINSSILDKSIMCSLRQALYESTLQVFEKHIKELNLTENGALQLIFDFLFITAVLHQDVKLPNSETINYLQNKIDPINWASYEAHFKPNVNKFYIKQSLIFGVLTNASNETYERARKAINSQQQGQYNVLPLAAQSTRFTLLPIGHLTSSSTRAR